jgi:hypothetical protein
LVESALKERSPVSPIKYINDLEVKPVRYQAFQSLNHHFVPPLSARIYGKRLSEDEITTV